MNNLIITGANGFIGKYLVKEFANHGINVLAIVRTDAGIIELKNFVNDDALIPKIEILKKDLISLDLKDFRDKDYHGWIHLAWGGVNREGVNDETTQKQNYELAKHCLCISQKIGCRYFSDSGSRAEYGKECEVIGEDVDDNKPLNVYGLYKKEFYQYAKDYCNKYDMKYQHFRLFSVIGPEDHPWSVIMTACKKVRNQEPMTLGACTQIFNFLDVIDVAKAIFCCYQQHNIEESNGIINIASNESKTLKEYLDAIPIILEKESILEYGKEIGFQSNPIVDKLINIYGWKQTMSFEDSIKRIDLNSENKGSELG